MNYAEEFAYWYFRLNGFFALTNFVVHRGGKIGQSGDVDLVAVRPPFTFEPIGGQPEDLDERLTRVLDFRKTIGVICEVKTGDYNPAKLFPAGKLEYAIGRLGLVPRTSIAEVAIGLSGAPIFPARDVVFTKVLITKIWKRDHDESHGLRLPLDVVKAFLSARVARYPIEKYNARMLFGGVFQYAASRANV